MSTLLRNARIVLPEKVRESGSLLIEGPRISQIISDALPEAVSTDSAIDLEGATLYPGFIDIHIHGAIGVDVTWFTAPSHRVYSR